MSMIEEAVELHSLKERIKELEDALSGWEIIGRAYDTEFSPPSLKDIARMARVYWIKNPLVKAGVNVQSNYVWGRGVNVSAVAPEINGVLQAFIDDPNNLVQFTEQQARLEKERELQLDGNLFFTLFVHPVTGKVRLSSIPFFEIDEIIRNPDNRKQNWFYKRVYHYEEFDLSSGRNVIRDRTTYYRDWRYDPPVSPVTIGGHEVSSSAVIYHIKVGGFSDWAYGLSEVYSMLDWAKAYTDFLSNFASVVRSLARYTWNLTTKGGAKGVQAARTKLGTTVNGFNGETNPPAVTASTFASGGDDRIEPIRTSGSTTSADEGRPLKLMVAAGAGIPETFFGDADVGNHATAKTLDRPTELAFKNRQTLWKGVLDNLCDYVLFHAVRAPEGPLRAFGEIVQNEYGEATVNFDPDIDATYKVEFPPLLEQDTQAYISGLVSAFTLDGKQVSPLFANDPKYIAKTILNAIGEAELDEILDRLFPETEEGEEGTIEINPQVVEEALGRLTEALNKLQEAQPHA
jgi:hypothetical protein